MDILLFSDTCIRVYWNGSKTFNVFCDDENIDCFETMDVPTWKQAQQLALNHVQGER